jgi:uncharacterized membrane protein
MALDLKHQTAAQFAARFWARLKAAYQAGDKLTFHKMIYWIWKQVQDGNLTNDQVRQSFNAAYGRSLTTAQWNAFVTARLVPVKDRYLAWLAEGDL